MNSRIINGKTTIITGSGGSVSIHNGQVIVNGQVIESGLSGIVEVKWEGPAAAVTSDVSVSCGDVQGNVRAGGSVNANNVGGSVTAGGSVNCGTVGGNINAGGLVSCRR